jgi:hypothetical protein
VTIRVTLVSARGWRGRLTAEQDRQGLSLDREGSLVTRSSSKTTLLHKAIRDSVRVLDVDATTHSGSFKVGRPSGQSAYSVMVAPIRPRTDAFGVNNAVALVLINPKLTNMPCRLASSRQSSESPLPNHGWRFS